MTARWNRQTQRDSDPTLAALPFWATGRMGTASVARQVEERDRHQNHRGSEGAVRFRPIESALTEHPTYQRT